MSAPFRITLIQVNADVTALTAVGDKIEHGQHEIDEVCRLAAKLLKLDVSGQTKAEPGIIVQRGDKGWRIAAHQGRLRVHKSMSLFDDFWTADRPEDILQLPPFKGSAANTSPAQQRSSHAPRKGGSGTMRAVGEVAGLFAVALVLVWVGLRFGLPQHRLSDLPPDVTIVTSAEERASVFAAVAGSYATGNGKAPGNTLVVISSDGQVSLGAIGKDGKPTPPRIQEQARAGRRGSIACVITSFGIIAGIAPPETVKVNNFQYRRAVTTP